MCVRLEVVTPRLGGGWEMGERDSFRGDRLGEKFLGGTVGEKHFGENLWGKTFGGKTSGEKPLGENL